MEVIALIMVFILLPAVYAGFVYAPWLPTRKRDHQRIQDLLDLQHGEIFYDLGSGTGGVVISMADKGAIAKGIELHPFLYIFSRCRAWAACSSAQFYLGNFFSHDLSDANYVYLFGTPKTLQGRILKKLQSECKPGTIVMSYAFRFKELTPQKIDKPTENDLSIYLYKLT